ncbi:hypothetical protein ACFYPG_14460 [Micromonospora sp. NPDC005553]|uniref:hypothetical protein n=1 Tax=Micromonospora sp. NPDC005553 TaxID=3364232 RepID=UPI0036C641E6
MPDSLNVWAGWACVGLALLFALNGVRLLREERNRRLTPSRPFSGRELLWESAAMALLGTGNLVGGTWVLLAIPAVIIMMVLLARLFARSGGRRRQSR